MTDEKNIKDLDPAAIQDAAKKIPEELKVKDAERLKTDKLDKLAHGGIIGTAHPSTMEELARPELTEEKISPELVKEKIADPVKEKLGKLAHGGVVGTAHPSAMDDIARPEPLDKK